MKKRNIKNLICILSAICFLSSMQVYAQDNSFNDKYMKKAVQQQKTDNITQEYLSAVEQYFYDKLNNQDYKEALDIINYLIDTDKSFYGEYHPQTGFAYVGKARYYTRAAIYDLAKQNIDKAFEIYQKNIDNWDIKSNAITSYMHFYAAAEMQYEVLKYLNMLTLKEFDEPAQANQYREYGNVYAAIKDFDKALDFYNKYYAEMLKSNENINLANYNYYMLLASLYENKVYYRIFNDYLLKAEKELNKIEDSDKKLRISFNMIKIQYFMDTNDYDNAKKLLDETKIITDEFGEKYHKENLNLAYFDYYKEMKDMKSVNKYINKLTNIYQRYPSDSLQFLRLSEKQIDMYKDAERIEDANMLIQNALNKISKVKEYMPSLYAKYLRKAFEVKLKENKTNEAKGYLDESFKIYSGILPETAYEFYDLYKNYGEFYEREDEIQKALECYNKAIEINSGLQGKEHKDIADLYDSLKNIYLGLENQQKAVECIDKTIEIYKKSYGSNNIEVYDKIINKYHLYNNMGQNAKAEELLKSINNDFENNKVKGQSLSINQNLNIINGYNELANKNYEKAADYARKAMTYAKYKQDKRNVYELYYHIYSQSGNSVKAYKYKKLAHVE